LYETSFSVSLLRFCFAILPQIKIWKKPKNKNLFFQQRQNEESVISQY